MKAKLINEFSNFKKKRNPKDALGIPIPLLEIKKYCEKVKKNKNQYFLYMEKDYGEEINWNELDEEDKELYYTNIGMSQVAKTILNYLEDPTKNKLDY